MVVEAVGPALALLAALVLLWWRSHPREVVVASLTVLLVATAQGEAVRVPDVAYVVLAADFLLLALAWSGRAAWLVAGCAAAYVVALVELTDVGSWVAAVMFTAPPFVAGTALRLRQELADELARRVAEVEDERELFTRLAVQHERARIASELHDMVGHAISVMVIQAAAGQRLVDTDPARTREAFDAISESARQGQQDVQRLVELLGGTPASVPDLGLVEEVAERARRSGLEVSCRFEGDLAALTEPVAHVAFRVVQESLTNALRYAPGSAVQIVIGADADARLAVRVENGPAAGRPIEVTGSGSGLRGLRERVQSLGGQLSAGALSGGGWSVLARLPLS